VQVHYVLFRNLHSYALLVPTMVAGYVHSPELALYWLDQKPRATYCFALALHYVLVSPDDGSWEPRLAHGHAQIVTPHAAGSLQVAVFIIGLNKKAVWAWSNLSCAYYVVSTASVLPVLCWCHLQAHAWLRTTPTQLRCMQLKMYLAHGSELISNGADTMKFLASGYMIMNTVFLLQVGRCCTICSSISHRLC
jgi:hypothetical protein